MNKKSAARRGADVFPTLFESYFSSRRRVVERRLRELLPIKWPRQLYEAMRYSVFSDGKRVRPVLALAAAEICGRPFRDALDAACALEMIHTYSLMHDDLPALDDDDYRRGKFTSHKKFGEDMAILAGDALLTLAFELIGKNAARRAPRLAGGIVARVAAAVGPDGMVGGQVADVKYSVAALPRSRAAAALNYIHLNKTAKLIEISAALGALIAGASGRKVKALETYGRNAGLAFQITDDLLDAGEKNSDAKKGRLTYPALRGIPASCAAARDRAAAAKRALGIFPRSRAKEFLENFSDFIVERKK